MKMLARKTLVLLMLLCMGLLIFINQPSVLLSLEKKEDVNVRVLLGSKKSKYQFQSNSKSWQIFSGKQIETPLTLHASDITLSFCDATPKTRYFAQSSNFYTWDEALKQAQAVYQCVRKTDLNVYIIESEKNTFRIEIGTFEQAVDASFFCSLMETAGSSFNLQLLDANHLFATLQWLKEPIYLRSDNFNAQASVSFWYIKDALDKNWIHNAKTYPFFLVNNFNPQQQLMITNELPLEEYLRSVVPAEMPYRWHPEALKAQAVASRTFAWSRALQARKNRQLFDLTDDTYSQVYLGCRYFYETDTAIEATRGQILHNRQQLVESVFHSTSGGHTENNEFVWSGSPRTYLRGVASKGEEISPHFTWYKCYKENDFLNAVNHFLSSKNQKENLDSINEAVILEKGSSPRIRKMKLNNDKEQVILTGQELQSIFSLKSTWFDMLVWKPLHYNNDWRDFMTPPSTSDTWIYIYGRGWGHGVGMSQYGAAAMANQGANYTQILLHYYQGSELAPISQFAVLMPFFLPSSFLNPSPHSCQLYFDPSPLSVEVHQNWKIQLKISSSSSIQGISMDVVFDPQLVKISEDDIHEGPFLQTGGKTTIFLKSSAGNKIHIGIGREGKAGGVTGEGTVLEIHGKALKKGRTLLELRNLHIMDSQLEEVPVQAVSLDIFLIEPDRTVPKTLIVEYPPRYINQPFVTFRWTGSDNETSPENLFYSYQLNEEGWSIFSKETIYTFHLINDGAYLFSVRARDEAGNIDSHPPVYTFFLDMTPPLLQLDPYPADTIRNEIRLSGKTEPDVTLLINAVRCPVDRNGNFYHDLTLSPGDNAIRLIAIDPASNASTLDIMIKRLSVSPILISLTIGSQKAIVNDHVKTLDAAPFIEQGRTLVPLRFIAESFLASVEWINEEKKISIHLKHPFLQRYIELWIGLNQARVDDKIVPLDVAPKIIPPGRTFVPIRFIAEEFGSKVEWYPQTQSILITFPDPELL